MDIYVRLGLFFPRGRKKERNEHKGKGLQKLGGCARMDASALFSWSRHNRTFIIERGRGDFTREDVLQFQVLCDRKGVLPELNQDLLKTVLHTWKEGLHLGLEDAGILIVREKRRAAVLGFALYDAPFNVRTLGEVRPEEIAPALQELGALPYARDTEAWFTLVAQSIQDRERWFSPKERGSARYEETVDELVSSLQERMLRQDFQITDNLDADTDDGEETLRRVVDLILSFETKHVEQRSSLLNLNVVCVDEQFSGYGVLSAVLDVLEHSVVEHAREHQNENAVIALVPQREELVPLYQTYGFARVSFYGAMRSPNLLETSLHLRLDQKKKTANANALHSTSRVYRPRSRVTIADKPRRDDALWQSEMHAHAPLTQPVHERRRGGTGMRFSVQFS